MNKTLHDIFNLDEENQKRFNDFFEVYRIESEVETKDLEKNYFYGDKENRKCRFCGKSRPVASFKKEAHLIPQFFGNRYLLSAFECDTCNEFFGTAYENSFSNYLSAYRPFSFLQSSKNNKTPKHKTIQKLSDGFNAEFTIQKTVDNKVEIVFTEGLEELGLKCQTTRKIINGCESIKDEVHYIVFNFMATSFYEDR